MVEKLAKLREPAVWILLVWLWLRTLVVLIRGLSGGDGPVSALSLLSTSFLSNSFGFLILGLLVASCAVWRPSPNARTLTLIALITVGALTVLGFFFAFANFSYGAAAGLLSLLDIVIPGLIAVGLFTIYGGLPAPAPKQQALSGGYGSYAQPGQPYGQPQQQPGQDWGQQPNQQGPYGGAPQQPGYLQAGQPPSLRQAQDSAWQPGQAAGQSWSTAGEAASGAAGSATGQQWGGPQGWGTASGSQSSASAAEYTAPVPFPPAQPTALSWGQPVQQQPAPPSGSHAWGQPQAPASAAEPPEERAPGAPQPAGGSPDESVVQTRLVPPFRPSPSADPQAEGDASDPYAGGRDDQPKRGDEAPSWWDSPGR